MPQTNEKDKRGQVEFTIKNEVKLDPATPLPINYGCDSFYIVRGKKYLPFLGNNDKFPNLLLEARLISTSQNSCITSIAESVIGNGLVMPDETNPDAKFIDWMANVNNEQQTLDDALNETTDGERTHGNVFVEIKKGNVLTTPFLKIYVHSLLKTRLGAVDPITGRPKDVIVSEQFGSKGVVKRLSNPLIIPLYDPNALDKNSCWIKNTDGTESTMLHFKNRVSGIDHYGLPASIAGLRYQVLEGKAAQFNIDNFDNNMILGGMLILKSAMTEGEADATAKKIILSHTGTGKTGRVAVVSSESGLDDVEFKEYKTEKDGSFIEMDKRVEEKIVAANQWDAMLAGLTRNSSLGTGNSYIRAIWDVKEAILLKPYRKKLIDKIVKPIATIYAEVFSAPEVAKYKFAFKSAMPFSFLGDIDPELFMEVNEARELAGLTTDEKKNGVYLSEMNSKGKTNVQDKPTTT